MNFETVIGLEVHCELKTKSKMFSGAPVTFGEAPNTNANIVDMGMTGAMPVLNKSGVEFAIRVCSALNMEIDELVQFDRKNYYIFRFYQKDSKLRKIVSQLGEMEQ